MKKSLQRNISSLYSPPMKDWTAKQIVALREKAGLTQEQLAHWLGVSQANVSQMETGKESVGTQSARLLSWLAERVATTAAVQSSKRKRGSQ